MRAQSDVTAALLIWLSDGARPRSGDFRANPSAEVIRASCRTRDGRRLASCGTASLDQGRIQSFDPDQVRSARGPVNDLKCRSPYTV
jgi:hypothetical protein